MTTQREQAQPLRPLLARVRTLVRRYVWIEGLAVAIGWIALAFWISLALDWSFEPPPAARRVMLGLIGAVLCWILYRYILRRIFVRIDDTAAAIVLERRFPAFHDSLVTTVELAHEPRAAEFNREMLEHTRQEAQATAANVELGRLFRWPPLVARSVLSGLLVASVVVFGVLESNALGVWFSRNLQFSDQLWPRWTRLSVDDFAQGVVKVGKGADRVVIVHAETKWHSPDRVVPDKVQIRYQSADGARAREYMSQEGEASESHPYSDFKYVFKGILVPLRFDIFGGDDKIRDLRIEVVDNPVIEQFTLACEYPAYMNRSPREIPVTGTTSIPQGSKVKILARANKPLVEVTLQRLQGQALAPQPSPDITGDDRREFSVSIDPLMEDYTLLFSLLDADGIRTREPIRLTLTSAPDDPPQVAVRLRGIGSAITAQARLPIEGEITDAYGVAKAWFEYTLDQQQPREQLFTHWPELAQSLKYGRQDEEALDLQEMGLEVGHKLTLAVKASDACTLNDQPNVGSSEPYTLNIVTPEELRAMLEARELTLRRQFEQIVDEMTETRDSLARVDFATSGTTSSADKPAENQPTGASRPAGAEPEDKLKPKAAEPGDTADAAADDKPLSAVTLRRLRIQRAQQNSQKSGLETLGVAGAFDDIREELVNNRIDTEELRLRLGDGIVVPLRRICEARFPKLDRNLEELKNNVTDPTKRQAAATAARQEADAILVEMDQVLHKMLELEQFNELVEQLRQIIDLQSKVNDDTQKRRKEKAKSLLKEE